MADRMRRVVAHPLRVDPAITGAELASPMRRLGAILVDGVILILPTVLVALLVAGLSLQRRDPAAMRALRTLLGGAQARESMAEVWRGLLPTLIRLEAPGLPAAVVANYEGGHIDEAVAELRDWNIMVALHYGEEEIANHKAPRVIRLEVEKLISPPIRAASILGVPALYFTVLLVVTGGATPGKWMAGTRVRRLDGHHITLYESFERFAGYLHIPAMVGLPILDLWRDPNRSMPHDRTVHTVVLRHRKVAAPAAQQYRS
jgi:uncharacterized RDD family membrane protein YckC